MKELYPFQEEVVPLLMERNTLLADDCGCGKTITALEAAKRANAHKTLVVCPKSVKAWWVQNITDQEAGYARATVAAGRGVNYDRVANYQGHHPIWLVTHYEALRHSIDELRKVDWDWIIADEAHRVKNRKAKQTKALKRIPAHRKVALTATPYGRNPADMWSILHWLYPKEYTSYWRFYDQYVESYQPRGQRFRIVQGPKNLRALGQEIAPFYRRRMKSEVLDLPPLTYSDVAVAINGRQEALYWKLLKESYAEFSGHEVILENALVAMIRLHQVAVDPGLLVSEDEDAGPLFSGGIVPSKVAWLVDWLEDHPDEPVVIVSRYRRFVERWLRDLAPEACIVGGMKEADTTSALETFQRTGRIVGSLAAICEGVNLQRAATIIVTDGTWSPVQEYQLSQRIYRIGQDRPCQVIHLVGVLESHRKRTVDFLMRRALERRMDQQALLDEFVQEVIDGPSSGVN